MSDQPKQKTAIRQLIGVMEKSLEQETSPFTRSAIRYLIIRAKEEYEPINEQQIMNAYHCGRTFENKYPDSSKTYNESAIIYLNETFENHV